MYKRPDRAPTRKDLQSRGQGLRVRFTPAELTLVRVLVLVPLQAVCVEGPGLDLAVPRGPHCVCQMDECGHILHPPGGDGWIRVHVEGAAEQSQAIFQNNILGLID